MSRNNFLSNQISSLLWASAGLKSTWLAILKPTNFRYSQVHSRALKGGTHFAQCGLISTVPSLDLAGLCSGYAHSFVLAPDACIIDQSCPQPIPDLFSVLGNTRGPDLLDSVVVAADASTIEYLVACQTASAQPDSCDGPYKGVKITQGHKTMGVNGDGAEWIQVAVAAESTETLDLEMRAPKGNSRGGGGGRKSGSRSGKGGSSGKRSNDATATMRTASAIRAPGLSERVWVLPSQL